MLLMGLSETEPEKRRHRHRNRHVLDEHTDSSTAPLGPGAVAPTRGWQRRGRARVEAARGSAVPVAIGPCCSLHLRRDGRGGGTRGRKRRNDASRTSRRVLREGGGAYFASCVRLLVVAGRWALELLVLGLASGSAWPWAPPSCGGGAEIHGCFSPCILRSWKPLRGVVVGRSPRGI